MLFGSTKKEIKAVVEDAVKGLWADEETKLKLKVRKLREIGALEAQIVQYKETLVDLRIERAKKDEEFEKRNREIEHKVGLEKTRQEQELDLGKRDAILSVGENNLIKDRDRFQKQMEFHKEQLTEQIDYLKDLMTQLMKRMPSANISIKHGSGGEKNDD